MPTLHYILFKIINKIKLDKKDMMVVFRFLNNKKHTSQSV